MPHTDLHEMNAATRCMAALPAGALKLLACEILLADPEALGDDTLEGGLYILRGKLRAVA